MEIDKKVIKKLIDALEDLKESLDKSGEKFDNSNNEQLIEKSENLNFKSVKSPIIGTAFSS